MEPPLPCDDNLATWPAIRASRGLPTCSPAPQSQRPARVGRCSRRTGRCQSRSTRSRLWHLATLLREHRGDGLAELRTAGYVDTAGKLTGAGRSVKQDIEKRTDELAWSAYAELSPDDLNALADALRPIARAVVQAGDIPLDAPMGLNLRELAG